MNHLPVVLFSQNKSAPTNQHEPPQYITLVFSLLKSITPTNQHKPPDNRTIVFFLQYITLVSSLLKSIVLFWILFLESFGYTHLKSLKVVYYQLTSAHHV
jgi:hypothetical protein